MLKTMQTVLERDWRKENKFELTICMSSLLHNLEVTLAYSAVVRAHLLNVLQLYGFFTACFGR